MIIGGSKEKVIENIKDAVESEEYNAKVELDDPKLSEKDSKKTINTYLRKKRKITYKLNNVVAKEIIRFATWNVSKNTEIIGLENIDNVKTGAFITSNHFNPMDNVAVRKFAKKAGKKKLYIISQETNLAMGGLIGFIMNHCNLIPICNQMSYMKNEFQDQLQKILGKNNFILIYPEQEMWFNYKKPRPLKPGAYYYASKYNVPIISCFVEIREREKIDNEEFKKVQYKIHVLKPIYPDQDKTDKENAAWMKERDYSQKRQAYEEAYGKELDYTFEDDDIAGWIN